MCELEPIELGTILHMEKGKKPKAQSKQAEKGYLPYVDIKAFEQGIIENYADVDNCLLCEDGDLVIVCDGSRSGLTGYAIKGVVGSTLSKISADGVERKYLHYFVQSKYMLLNTRKKGTGTPHLNAQILKKLRLLVPPVPVQERIVAHIEELFSQLDASVSELKTAKERLTVYRQAVLREAFTLQCETIPIRQLCSVVRGGSPRPAGDKKFYNGSIPFLKVADLTNTSEMYLTKYTSTIKEAGLKKTRLVPANTLLISNSGATLGVPKICKFPTTFNDGIAAFLHLDEKKEYLPYHYYFWLSKTLVLRAINQGAAQPNLNTTIIGNVSIPHCTYEEQKIVSQQIESQFAVCDRIEKIVDIALKQAEVLRQSILKKAFEGKIYE